MMFKVQLTASNIEETFVAQFFSICDSLRAAAVLWGAPVPSERCMERIDVTAGKMSRVFLLSNIQLVLSFRCAPRFEKPPTH